MCLNSSGWNLMQNRPRSALRSSVFVFDPQNMVFAPVPTTHHKSAVMDHRWDQVSDSGGLREESITAQQNQHHWQSTHYQSSPTQTTTLLIFPEPLGLQTELFWSHTFQSLF